MKNREMLAELKRIKSMVEHIKDIASKIVEHTFDDCCCGIDDLIVKEKTVEVEYEYNCLGEYGHNNVCFPIEWFDEGFDYKTAYQELKMKEAKNEKIHENAAKESS